MRDPERIHAITTALYLLWSKPENHDLRLGQLLGNLQYKNVQYNDIFYTEDDEWLNWLMTEYEK